MKEVNAMNIIKRAIEWIKSGSFLNTFRKFRNNKHFSTYLVTTFAALATLSVVVIVIALYGYFDKRVEAEFRKKILAENGQQAVEIYGQKHREIDLAIIDLVMPNLDGFQTIAKLKEIDPDLLALLSSGNHEERETLPDSSTGVDGFLVKPYRVDQLQEILQKAFSERRSSRKVQT